jgi:branched-chain amino acid transport system ATP-binding protein
MGKVLEVERLSIHFGGLLALKNVSFYLEKQEILGLIGPNGAGKTTLFNCISNFYTHYSGRILLDGVNITGMKPHQICKMGIARTFQIPKPFLRMTVLQNVVAAIIGKNFQKKYKEAQLEALKWVDFVGLKDKADNLASNLTLKELRLLELCRALATEPKVLLIDEIAAGSSPAELLELGEALRKVREMGISIISIEHVMKFIMNIADRILVLHQGEIIAEGPPEKVVRNEKVLEVYLGKRSGGITVC